MTKAELRIEYLTKRKVLTEVEIQTASQKIHDWLFRSLPIHSYATIHTFLPIKKQNEVDTWLIIKTLQRDFATNVIIPKANEDGTLSNYLLDENTVLEENKWGIQEPVVSPQSSVVSPQSAVRSYQSSVVNSDGCRRKSSFVNQEIDLVLVPLIVFDKSGYRVGYGKGYYDRFLAECRSDVVKVGLSVFDPIESISNLNDFDIKLDFCVTPQKIWQFS
jgi:5-formyltetrahydrofolate cyclo-ligase